MNKSSARRLLLIGIDSDELGLLRQAALDCAPESALIHVESMEAACDALAQETFVCVVASQPLLDELLRHPQSAPVVGLIDRSPTAVELMRRGIRDALELEVARRAGEVSELRSAAKRKLAASGHFELAADLTPIYVNERCTQLAGLVQDDLSSFTRGLAEVDPEDLPAIYASVDDLRAGRDVHTVHRRNRPVGEVLILETRISSVVDANGTVLGYVGSVVDITEARRLERRERASRAQLQALFDHAPSVVWFKDIDSRYMFVNRRFGELFEHDPKLVPGQRDDGLMSERAAAAVRERDLGVLGTGAPAQFEDVVRTSGGPRRHASTLFPVFDHDGDAIGVGGMSFDVTARREIEERFRRSFDDAPVGMTMARRDGTWLRVNQAMADLLDYPLDELQDRLFSDFTHPDDKDEDRRRAIELAREGGTAGREKRMIRRDGSEIWVLSHVNIARNPEGQMMWALTHVLDITQRKAAEHELQRQQVDMHTIARVARDAGSSEQPAHEVCMAAAQITGASAAGLLELRGSDRLVLAAATRDGAPLGMEIRPAGPPTGPWLAAVSKERLFLADARHAIRTNIVEDAQMASVVFEPILRGNEVLGVMLIAWATPRDALTPRESSVIRLLAAEMGTIIERARLTAQLRELARTDPLTGLANRRVWDERIGVELNHARRAGSPLCLAVLDLDHFKAYNDTHGHQAGDRLLSGATAAWADELRTNDLLARVGGDEFALLLPDCDLEGGRALVERLRLATPSAVGCSVGIIQWNGEERAEAAVARADAALYAAKESGRARSVAG